MPNLKQHFDVHSRDDIIKICDLVANQIRKTLNQEKPLKPILIAINGSPGMGKSIFWDRVREVLLEHGGIFVKKDSSSDEKKDRLYETWVGKLKNSENKIKIFCANMHQGDETMTAMVGPESLNLLGDIIILSNVPDELFDAGKIDYNIFMDMNMDAIRNHPSPSGWEMSLQLTTLKPI